MKILEIVNLCKTYGKGETKVDALKNVSFDVDQGEFVAIVALTYLAYYFLIIRRSEQLKKFKNNTFYKYLVKVYKLDPKKHDMKKMVRIIALANGFIIATTFEIVLCIKGLVLRLLMATSVFIILDLVIYHIIGKHLKRSED